MIESAYKYWLIYRGLNLHYKDGSKYDYSMYGPLTRGADPEKFEYSADRFTFIKLAKAFPVEEHYTDYLHWTALKNGQLPYFRNLGNENDFAQFREQYLKVKLSITYNFGIFLDTFTLDYVKTNGEDLPRVLEDYFDGTLHVDFYYILDRTFNLTKKYLEIFPDDLHLQSKMNKYLRYRLVARVDEYENLKNKLRAKI